MKASRDGNQTLPQLEVHFSQIEQTPSPNLARLDLLKPVASIRSFGQATLAPVSLLPEKSPAVNHLLSYQLCSLQCENQVHTIACRVDHVCVLGAVYTIARRVACVHVLAAVHIIACRVGYVRVLVLGRVRVLGGVHTIPCLVGHVRVLGGVLVNITKLSRKNDGGRVLGSIVEIICRRGIGVIAD